MDTFLKLIFVALTFSACTPAVMKRDLHYIALGTEVAADGSFACDAASTHAALATSMTAAEQNPVMGPRPSGSTIVGYFAATSLATYGVNRALPDIYRILVNVAVVAVEADAVHHNATLVPEACGL